MTFRERKESNSIRGREKNCEAENKNPEKKRLERPRKKRKKTESFYSVEIAGESEPPE